MVENGYSPIVVSNLPLNEGDLDQLRPLTYRILQRENFGYDFGGYREGILVFQDQIKSLGYLALFNDSVWFPVQNTRSWLKDAEAAEKDLMGSISHVDIDQNDFHNAMSQLAGLFASATKDKEWIADPQSWLDELSNRMMQYKLPPKPVLALRRYFRARRIKKNPILFHYPSFSLLMGKNILRDPKFFGFWQRLEISDDWAKTIARGEIGFTQWVIEQSFSHGCLIHQEAIAKIISELEDEQLIKHLEKVTLASASRSFLEVYHQTIGSKPHPNMLNSLGKRILLQTLLRINNIAYSAPFYLFHEHQFQFFKKKNLAASTHGQKVAFDMIANMPEPIKSEMWATVQKTTQSLSKMEPAEKISGKRKIFGVWLGIPRIWS
jgi:hypothetical protein